MNELQIFNNPKFGNVRTITEDGKTLFCAKDVATALGYKNTRDAINRHCKGVVKRDGVSLTTNQHGTTTQQTVEMSFIPEGDIYRLAAKSELPGADEFESWIFDEVLPSIRATGGYALPKDYPSALRALADAEEKRMALETTNAALTEQVNVQQQQIAEMQPKASYYDVVLNCKDLVAISTIAKDYGWSANRMNTYLHEAGVQYKQGNIWLLYQKHAE